MKELLSNKYLISISWKKGKKKAFFADRLRTG